MTTDNNIVLATDNLQYAYGSHTLQFPDLQLHSGETCALLGPSGCGKTTFLHLLAGLLTPKIGSVEINAQIISALSQRKRDQLRGREIGIVLQQLRLIKALSVVDNLLLAQRLAGLPTALEPARQLLAELDLLAMANCRPAELSQGQVQRVAIARALINQPAIVLADEPTSSLDDANAASVLRLLSTMAVEHHAALVIVTHDSRLRGHLDQEVHLS